MITTPKPDGARRAAPFRLELAQPRLGSASLTVVATRDRKRDLDQPASLTSRETRDVSLASALSRSAPWFAVVRKLIKSVALTVPDGAVARTPRSRASRPPHADRARPRSLGLATVQQQRRRLAELLLERSGPARRDRDRIEARWRSLHSLVRSSPLRSGT